MIYGSTHGKISPIKGKGGDVLAEDKFMEAPQEDEEELTTWLDGFVESVKKERQGRTSILDYDRLMEFGRAIKLVEKAVKASHPAAKVTFEYGQPFDEFASVTIEGKGIEIKDVKSFFKALNISDNFDVYPLANGGVRIDLGFYGMTTHVN